METSNHQKGLEISWFRALAGFLASSALPIKTPFFTGQKLKFPVSFPEVSMRNIIHAKMETSRARGRLGCSGHTYMTLLRRRLGEGINVSTF